MSLTPLGLLTLDSGADGVRIAGYYADANAGTNWMVTTADGSSVSMTEFVAAAGRMRQSVTEAYARYRDSVRSDLAGFLHGQGYELAADGSGTYSATSVEQSGADTVMTSSRVTLNVVFEAQTGATCMRPCPA